jgi:hypothetical protein
VGRWYEPPLVLALPKPENEMADALVNLVEWCEREREPVNEIYPTRTSRDLPTILLSWMAS